MRRIVFLQKPVLTLLLCMAISVSHSQADQQWVKRYNGPNSFLDEATRLVLDASGNVYVTGGSYGSNNNYDYATVKYDAAGTQLWVQRYDGPAVPANAEDRSLALCVDASGNVYVTGYSYSDINEEDYATIKYNANGTQLWVQRYDGPAHSSDRAFAMAVDESGNVYVTGFSTGAEGTFDYATIKCDTDGNKLWVRRYDGLGQDQAVALTIDADKNVYITGHSTGSGDPGDKATIKYTTVKYNAAGKELWVRTHLGESGGSFATSLAVDGSGNVYVAGQSIHDKNDEENTDYATVKYDAFGTELWVKRYNGPGNSYDGAASLALDASGNVYVTGYSTGAASNTDFATIKYDAGGQELWVKRYNGPGNDHDAATALAVDHWGNIYVTGSGYDSKSAENYTTIKYDAQGDELWLKQYNGPGNLYDNAASIVIDSVGNVYITGQSYDTQNGADYATIKYMQTQTTWYQDKDRDGYGNTNVFVTSTGKPEGYVSRTGDCNDNDNRIHPKGPSICDGKDNDCDGLTDEKCSGAVLWYRDADNDEYGDAATFVKSTVKPEGYVSDHTDCNDSDRDIHPKGPALCDGKDNDCDGLVDEKCGVQSMTANGQLQLAASPNPATNHFTLRIQSTSNKPVEVRILNEVGTVVEVRRGVAPNTTLAVGHNYKTGIYYVEVLQDGKRTSVKLLKAIH